MREIIEFRIREKHIHGALPDDIGERLSDSVRRVVVATTDPLFAQIGRVQRELRARGDFLFYGWIPRHIYTRRELEAAEIFHIWPKKAFEPEGEDCGTVYDEATACPEVVDRGKGVVINGHYMPPSVCVCGVGARQVTPLFLDGRRIPRKVDFARTIAEEIVVSSQVRELFQKEGLQGAEFDPVRLSNKGGRASTEHYQLKVAGPRVELDASIRAGSDPFDESAHGRCPRGHIPGTNLLSEVTVQRRSLTGADLMATRQMFGYRVGVLRPTPCLLISPKAWRAIEKHKLKGLTIEVAHVKDETS